MVSVKADNNRRPTTLIWGGYWNETWGDTVIGYRQYRRGFGGYRRYRGRGGTNKAGFPHCSFYHRALWPTKAIVPLLLSSFCVLEISQLVVVLYHRNQQKLWHSWLFWCHILISSTGWTKTWEMNLHLWLFTFKLEIKSPPISRLVKRRGRGQVRWSIWAAGNSTNQPSRHYIVLTTIHDVL